jgi:5-dehydro-2-deoxygluconokinase
MDAHGWRAVDALIAERDPYCRGVLILGLNARAEQLARDFREARASTSCRGFAVGRTIFLEPSRAWLAGESDDAKLKREVRERFEALIGVWREARSVSAKERAT